jgi:hypothetical protein
VYSPFPVNHSARMNRSSTVLHVCIYHSTDAGHLLSVWILVRAADSRVEDKTKALTGCGRTVAKRDEDMGININIFRQL